MVYRQGCSIYFPGCFLELRVFELTPLTDRMLVQLSSDLEKNK